MTIEIKRMRVNEGGETVAISLVLQEEYESQRRELVITMAQYTELSPRKGEISQAFFEELEAAAAVTDAVRRGVSILSYGANSAKALQMKLRQRGVSGEDAKRAADYLQEKGYLREEADALRQAERDRRKGWGKTRILAHLKERGYGQAALTAAADKLRDVDFTEACANALARKIRAKVPTDREERERLKGYLFRLGFSLTEISTAFDLVFGQYP